MLAGELEQRLWHSHIIVEVASGVVHVVFLAQHGSNELLSGCLSVGASNTYNWYVELSAVLAGKVFVCLQGVVNENQHALSAVFERNLSGAVVAEHHLFATCADDVCIVNDCNSASLLQCAHGELVAVEGLTLERKEHASFWTVSAVGGYRHVCLYDIENLFYVHDFLRLLFLTAKIGKSFNIRDVFRNLN